MSAANQSQNGPTHDGPTHDGQTHDGQTHDGQAHDAHTRLGGAAHDLRQMLAVIRGRASFLVDDAGRKVGEAELRSHLLAMDLAAEDAAAILDRLEGREGPGEAEPPQPLEFIVRQAFDLILPHDKQSWFAAGRWRAEVQVPVGLAADVPAQVLREVLANLLTNIKEAMSEGGRVLVRASSQGDSIALRIEDEGPGVPEHLADRIFERGVSTSARPGRGLGLAGCRDLLERHGAGIQYAGTSSLGGAAFEIHLPAAGGEQGTVQVAGQARSATISSARRLLVVDDEPSVREMLQAIMGALAQDLHEAADADQALELFQPDRFQAVFLDQSLPGRSGLELAKQLRARDPRVVLVLVSGWGNEEILAAAPRQGVDLTARKPLTVDKIRQLLADIDRLQEQRKGLK